VTGLEPATISLARRMPVEGIVTHGMPHTEIITMISDDLIRDLLEQDQCLYGFEHTAKIISLWLLGCDRNAQQAFARKVATDVIAREFSEERNPGENK
jgi:hypothetical protein